MRQAALQQTNKAEAGRVNRTPSRLVRRNIRRGATTPLLNLQRTHGNRFVQRLLGGALVQRKCACGGKCDDCRDERLAVQRHADGSGMPQAVPAVVHNAARTPGQPLDPATRTFMEARFGQDFSRVRVHTGALAGAAARQLGAHAYTVGRDIFFASGQYHPQTRKGTRLLAHELTHVVQQAGGVVRSQLSVGPAGDAYEREADSVADSVASAGNWQRCPPLESHVPQSRRGVAFDIAPRHPAPAAAIQLKRDGGKKPPAPEKAKELKPCKEGWREGVASSWECAEKGMGTTCEGCGVELESWPENDSCRKVEKKGKPRTCLCDSVLGKVGTEVAAYKPKKCGGKLQVMNRETGDTKTVTVVDAGPYAKDRIIDLHRSVFGSNLLLDVCVSPYQGDTDGRLHNCWDGFGGVAPEHKPKPKPKSKHEHRSEEPAADAARLSVIESEEPFSLL